MMNELVPQESVSVPSRVCPGCGERVGAFRSENGYCRDCWAKVLLCADLEVGESVEFVRQGEVSQIVERRR